MLATMLLVSMLGADPETEKAKAAVAVALALEQSKTVAAPAAPAQSWITETWYLDGRWQTVQVLRTQEVKPTVATGKSEGAGFSSTQTTGAQTQNAATSPRQSRALGLSAIPGPTASIRTLAPSAVHSGFTNGCPPSG